MAAALTAAPEADEETTAQNSRPVSTRRSQPRDQSPPAPPVPGGTLGAALQPGLVGARPWCQPSGEAPQSLAKHGDFGPAPDADQRRPGAHTAPAGCCAIALPADRGQSVSACGPIAAEKPPRMQLFARVPGGRTVALHAGGASTVDAVKGDVYRKTRIPPAEQRLVFAGRELENGRALQDYGITANSHIYVLLRLRGGSGPAEAAITGVSQDMAWTVSKCFSTAVSIQSCMHRLGAPLEAAASLP